MQYFTHVMSVTDLEQLKTEKERLSGVVKAQNLTPEEVMRMNTEHETLARSIEDLKVKVTETNKLVMSLEVSLTNRVAATEEVIDQYNTLLSSPGLVPPNGEDLTIELNMASPDLQQVVKGPDMRKVARPTLSKWAEMYRIEVDAAKREKIAVDDQHDHVVNDCDDLIQEIETDAAKVHALTEQAEEIREVIGLAPCGPASIANHRTNRLRNKRLPSTTLKPRNWNERWLKRGWLPWHTASAPSRAFRLSRLRLLPLMPVFGRY